MTGSLQVTDRIVRGHRRCIHCGYGLTGQPVLRDEAYGLMLARCPECGRMACFEQESLLGRSGRFAAAGLAILWIATLAATWLAGGSATAGFAEVTGWLASDRYQSALRAEFSQAAEGAEPAATVQQPPVPTRPGRVIIGRPGGLDFATWWASQNPADRLAAAGGWRSAVQWNFLWLWIPLVLGTAAIGAFWSVALHRVRGGRLVTVSLLIMAPAIAIATANMLSWHQRDVGWAGDVAMRQLGVPTFVASLVVALAATTGGLLVGRRLTRGVLRLTVPQRLRGALAPLWLTDGREPPVPRAK
jgi:hypothetical protein